MHLKQLIAAVFFSSLAFLCACGTTQNSSSQTLADYTAESVVQYINDMVAEADNIFIVGMDEPTDGDYSEIGVTAWMSMKFDENSSGTLDECRLYWFDGWPDEETSYSAGFYVSILTDAFVYDIKDDIADKIQTRTPMSWDSNNTVVEYSYSGTGANYLTFSTKKQYEEENKAVKNEAENYSDTVSSDTNDNSDQNEVVLDEELTALASQYMNESFGNAYGNPTSWYKYIENIFIYSTPNDNYTATIFVSSDCQNADTIGNSLMMNFDEVTISYVIVVDDAGNLLFDRNNPLS